MNDMDNSLDRQKREKKFHDDKAEGKEKISSVYELKITNYVVKKLLEKIEQSENLKVLEIGCGTGWFTKKLAEKGGEIHAYDISVEGIKKNQKIKENEFKDRIYIYNMTAEELGFQNNVFDIIVANAVLHHTNLKKSIPEICRVVKKGGTVYFVEPLGHNPLLNFYRNKTPQLRTPDETPLMFSDIEYFRTMFNTVDHKEYGFFVLIVYILRYVIKDRELLDRIIHLLHRFDEVFIQTFPFIRKHCWLTLVTLRR